MNKKIACWGAVLALLAVVIGAFSAHTLKDIFTIEQMRSFETAAVRYQMHHAIVLLIIGFHADRLKKITLMSFFFITGTIFFISIYLLCIQDFIGQSFSFWWAP